MASKLVDTTKIHPIGTFHGVVIDVRRRLSLSTGKPFDMVEIKSDNLEGRVFIGWTGNSFKKGDRVTFKIIHELYRNEEWIARGYDLKLE